MADIINLKDRIADRTKVRTADPVWAFDLTVWYSPEGPEGIIVGFNDADGLEPADRLRGIAASLDQLHYLMMQQAHDMEPNADGQILAKASIFENSRVRLRVNDAMIQTFAQEAWLRDRFEDAKSIVATRSAKDEANTFGGDLTSSTAPTVMLKEIARLSASLEAERTAREAAERERDALRISHAAVADDANELEVKLGDAEHRLAEVEERAREDERLIADVEGRLKAALENVEYRPGDYPLIGLKQSLFLEDVKETLAALRAKPEAHTLVGKEDRS